MTTSYMPHYLAPATMPYVLRNTKLLLESFKKNKPNPLASLQLLKEEAAKDNLYLSEAENFSNQTPEELAHLETFDGAIRELQGVGYRDLYEKPSLAADCIAKIQNAFNEHRKQQRLKFDKDFAAIPASEKERLWSIYEASLTQSYQPVAKFSQQINPEKLLSNAMRYYVQKVMGRKNRPYTKLQADAEDDLEFIQRAQFEDTQGNPIVVSYDKEGKITELHSAPHAKGEGLGDALAVLIANHGKMMPLKIAVPLSHTDILKAEMEPGLTLLIILLLHTLFQRIEINQHKNKVLKAAFEKGIPLKYISLIDNRGHPIPISHSEQEKLNQYYQKWFKEEVSEIDLQLKEQQAPSTTLTRSAVPPA